MRILPLAFLICLATPALAQRAVDIVEVRDNFIVAGIVAQKCNTTDPDRREMHDRNFTIVSRNAMQKILSRGAPGSDPEELRKQDLAHIEKLQDAAFNLVRVEGCKSDKVRQILRMHRMYETVRF
jgi:hypothetical protein